MKPGQIVFRFLLLAILKPLIWIAPIRFIPAASALPQPASTIMCCAVFLLRLLSLEAAAAVVVVAVLVRLQPVLRATLWLALTLRVT
jgi:hypothetical protein